MLLDGVNHIAWISKDAQRLKAFYARVFDADVGPTRAHGDKPGETMTVIRIGPHTELNIVTIEGNTEPQRQTPPTNNPRSRATGLITRLLLAPVLARSSLRSSLVVVFGCSRAQSVRFVG